MPDHGARRISEDALMLREGLDPAALSEEFLRADPFEHVVIDDFLGEAQAHRLADLLEAVDTEDWIWDPLPQQVNKWSMPDPAACRCRWPTRSGSSTRLRSSSSSRSSPATARSSPTRPGPVAACTSARRGATSISTPTSTSTPTRACIAASTPSCSSTATGTRRGTGSSSCGTPSYGVQAVDRAGLQPARGAQDRRPRLPRLPTTHRLPAVPPTDLTGDLLLLRGSARGGEAPFHLSIWKDAELD